MSDVVSSSIGAAEPSTAAFRRLDASAAWDLIFQRCPAGPKPLSIFDVRDEKSFALGHVDGAIHLSDARVPAALAETPKASTVVVYCYHGHASQMFASLFSSFGFSDVVSVDGGFEALAKEHAERRAAAEERDAGQPRREPELRYLAGDVVYCLAAIHNDGGIPNAAPDALIARAGSRGVVVQVGRAEADPRRTVYAIRFEDERGELGPAVGCLPDELTQESPARG